MMRWLLLSLCSLAVSGVPVSQAAADDLRLLFLGDQGPHAPRQRFDIIEPVFRARGVRLHYSEEVKSALTMERLAEFDGLLLYANIDAIAPENAVALLRYVDGGGAFVPVHCGSYCFRNNPEVVALIGGQFLRHGTGVFATTLGDAEHPVMQGFGGFASWDETYLHHLHNEAGRTVLEYRRGQPLSDGTRREPWTWVREHGEGRVFYTAWGHDERTWSQPGFQNLLERGVRWACQGDPSEAGPFGDRPRFDPPSLTPVPEDAPAFTFVDVGPKIPNYTPGERWGAQEAPMTLMQRPLSPAASLRHAVTPEGFSVKLAAWEASADTREPGGVLGGKPIAMNWDQRGRLWVCETVDYPNQLRPPGEGRDRLRVCEDTDGDGVMDAFTVFSEGLSIPTAVTFWKDGVIVQDGTRTMYLKDTSGDGRADLQKVLIADWALGDTHGGVSNLRYGHDGWFWGMQGYNNSAVTIEGNKQLPFRMGFFRFRLNDEMPPRVRDFEFVRSTDNNTWGLGFSEEGLVFGSTANHNPSVFMPIANRYYERVRGWANDRLSTIADTHLFDPITDNIRQVDHHGGYTAAVGHALYTARTYPQMWWNRTAFVAGPPGHLVGTFVLTPCGAGFTSTSPVNLFASDDEWTAPIAAEVGPDGNVWVLDWYNFIVQHNPTPQGFETGQGAAYESDLRDKTHGRIYRVLHRDGAQPIAAALDRQDTASLVAGLSHPVMGVRLHAQRILIEERATSAVPALIQLVRTPEVDEIGLNVSAVHALQTLRALGVLDTSAGPAFDAVVSALSHDSAAVRRVAAEVLPRTTTGGDALLESGVGTDPDAQVRLAALLALSEMPAVELGSPLIALCRSQDAGDQWLRDAATAAAAAHATAVLEALPDFRNATPADADLVRVTAEHFARGGPSSDALNAAAAGWADAETPVVAAALAGLSAGWPDDAEVTLTPQVAERLAPQFDRLPTAAQVDLSRLAARWKSETLASRAAALADTLLARVEDAELSIADRLLAARNVVDFLPNDADVANRLLEQADSKAPPTLATGIVDALVGMRPELVAGPLTDRLGTSTPAVRKAVVRTLLARSATTASLLDAIEAGDVSGDDLSLSQRQQLTSSPTPAVRRRATAAFRKSGGTINADRHRVLESKLSLAGIKGDSAAGKGVFKQHCGVCHQYRGEGKKIGPALDGMAVHPKSELLAHILDPNRSVEGNYRTYTALTDSGRVISGMLTNETQTVVSLVDSQGVSHSVGRDELEELIPSRRSVMPEGFEKTLSDGAMTDLLEYLTDVGDFLPLPLDAAATVVSTRGLFYDACNPAEAIRLERWGLKTVEGVPFRVADPDGDRRNMIMLRSTVGPVADKLPESARLPCHAPASAIHLLSGVGGWAARAEGDRGVAMVVRLHYDGGQTEDHELIDGRHFADYNGPFEVPDSKRAFSTNDGRYQMRYLKVTPTRRDRIETIEFLKGPTNVAPIVAAVTLETAD